MNTAKHSYTVTQQHTEKWKALADQLQPLLQLTDVTDCNSSVTQAYNHITQLFCNQHYDTCKTKATDLQQILHAQINSVQWKDVSNTYRTMYIRTTAVLVCSVLLSYPRSVIAHGVLTQLIRELDIGIMYAIDNDTLIKHVVALINTIEQLLPTFEPVYGTHTSKRRKLTAPTIRYNVEHLSSPTLIDFKQQYLATSTPVVLIDAAQHIPAVSRWTIHYLLQLAEYRTVPVEIGSNYMADDWTQQLMTFGEFVNQYIHNDTDTVAYCAQHNLLKQIPTLYNDISVPDYCITAGDVIINTWLGTANTVSNLHCDAYHNILLQLQGSKYVRLYDNKYAEQLYLHDGIMSNTSQVDVQNVDADSFPLFDAVPYTECVLRPGEMLYIPLGWYHYVQSLEVSISVSFWFN